MSPGGAIQETRVRFSLESLDPNGHMNLLARGPLFIQQQKYYQNLIIIITTGNIHINLMIKRLQTATNAWWEAPSTEITARTRTAI